jgi:hypothetical protein
MNTTPGLDEAKRVVLKNVEEDIKDVENNVENYKNTGFVMPSAEFHSIANSSCLIVDKENTSLIMPLHIVCINDNQDPNQNNCEHCIL